MILSSLAVAVALYWVTAIYQQFAIQNQNDFTASTLVHLVHQAVENEHERKVTPFIDEWSRLSTLVRGMKDNDAERARIAANRMMLTLEVAEGRVKLRNVIIYSKDMQPVAAADKGSGDSIAGLPPFIETLRERDIRAQRQITSMLWRNAEGRPLYSTVAPIGGFQVAGFVEFVSDPVADLAIVGDAVQGNFRLEDIHGDTLLEINDADLAVVPDRNLDTMRAEILDAAGDVWAHAVLTRDVSGFHVAVGQLRNRALWIVAAAILGIVIIGWLALRLSVLSRLRGFAVATEQLAEGQTDVDIPSTGPDEFKYMRTSLESLKKAVAEREHATAALRRSEERLKAIIDNSPSAINLKDPEGRYTLVNASTAADQGVEPEAMIGMTAFDHMPRRIAELVAAQEAEVLKTGQVSESELEMPSGRDGTRVVLMVKFPVLDANGATMAVGTIASNITERKQSEKALVAARERAEEQAKLQRIILDNIGQGILVFGTNGQPALWNDLATKLTGWSDGLLLKKLTLEQATDFQRTKYDIDQKILDQVDAFQRRVSAGQRDFVVTYQRAALDSDGWVQVSLRCLSDGMVVQTYQDITNLHLAIETAQHAQRAAEEANRAKSDFLSNMSHELRTPLNAIIGFTEFVVENDEEPISEEQHASLSQVLKAGRHLLVLINDVLDLSKIEAGALSLSIEPVDLQQVVDECLSLATSLAASHSVSLDNHLTDLELPAISADRIRFKQVFLNLLSNAIKYNVDPGRVEIVEGSATAGRIRIGVRDFGLGIETERLAHIFEPFDRLGAENSAVEGTGIGLTITKSLIEQMGGIIEAESVVGKGSTFWLEMPVSEQPVEHVLESDALSELRPSVGNGRVLYIEDNPANLELVRKIMSRDPGLDFIDASTGEEGLERARTEVPDVILVDINLPGVDGFQVMEKLGEMHETRDIPVIALTAAATDADKKRGQSAGFFSYLTKPITALELMETIRRALNPEPIDLVQTKKTSSGKVLVVDDLPINLVITRKQLAKIGVECDTEEDPVRALDMLIDGGYALALVDISMPAMSGLELTKRLRAAERVSGLFTPVVALTAGIGEDDYIERFRQAGMNGELTKPVTLKQLSAIVQRWLHLSDLSAPASNANPPALSNDTPPIDIEKFKQILGTDDPGAMGEMFDLFVALMPDEVDELSGAIKARDAVLTQSVAHRFKSAARNTAASRLSEMLQAMEQESKSEDWDKLRADLPRVKAECVRLEEFVRTRTVAGRVADARSEVRR